MQRLARLLGEVEQAVCVAEQEVAGRREVQALAFANKEIDAELGLELAHPRGHVRLHAMELLGGPRDAARVHDRAEDLKISKVHSLSCPLAFVSVGFSALIDLKLR